MRLIAFVTLGILLGPAFQSALAKTTSKAHAAHKGFMVFLNWHFLQPAPMIITEHFKKIEDRGPWQRYQGTYGAFDDIEVGVCQGKLTSVRAKTQKIQGGMEAFVSTWLEERLLEKITQKKDSQNSSEFSLVDARAEAACSTLAQKSSRSSRSY